MKPLNIDNKTCSPISSNCVIWQGPDIPCIKLCAGDSVSEIIAKLAQELCDLLDQTNVSNYDLACLSIGDNPPEDFKALIELLIDKVCEQNEIDPGTGGSAGCPDCVVSVAACLVEGGSTTMQLLDYVQKIANKICNILTQIATINSEISIINATLIDLQVQIDNISPGSLPSINVDCIISGSQPIDAVLEALMNDDALGYCRLLDATGVPDDINNAVLSQCIQDIDQPLAALALTPPVITSFSAYYSGSWINNANLSTEPTIANAINNIWIAICDIYNYAESLSFNVEDTSSVTLDYTSNILTAKIQDTNWKDLEGFNFYSGVAKPQCRRIGNQIHFRGTAVVPLGNPGSPSILVIYDGTSYNSPQGCDVFTGLSGGCNILPNGTVIFNQNTSVIPSSILSTATNLDGTYSLGYTVATRPIDINLQYGTALTAAVKVNITNDKKLTIEVLKKLEITNTRPNGLLGGSPLRFITSRVTQGEYIPSYISNVSNVHNVLSPSSVGTGYIAGQVFTVVSGTFYAGQKIYGSGILEDTWLEAQTGPTDFQVSKSQTIGTLGSPVSVVGVFQLAYTTDLLTSATPPAVVRNNTWPFSCDAGDPNQIGGFAVSLDGLIAYVDACTEDIKSGNCLPA
jgi:hypothetical protein